MGIIMSAPRVLEMGADGVLVLTLLRKKSYPVRCIIVKMHVTGDDFSTKCRIRCGTEEEGRREVTIDTSRTGVTVIEIKRYWAVSLIGLFSLPVTAGSRISVLVLPPPVKPVNTLALQHGIYLRPKPGGGYSEEHDMREYRPGDPVRSIHWKLSAKFDSTIIREPLEPPPHSRLVHFMQWAGATERDMILGQLRWTSDYLLKWQMPFYVKFGEDETYAEIRQADDLIGFLLEVQDKKSEKSVKYVLLPTRFSWIFRIEAGNDAKTGIEADAAANEQYKEVIK